MVEFWKQASSMQRAGGRVFRGALVARQGVRFGSGPSQEELFKYQSIGETKHSIGPLPQDATGYDIFGGKLNISPHQEERQDWEYPFLAAYIGGFTLAAVGLYYAPETSVKVWAKEEAIHRAEERAAAEELAAKKSS